MKWINRLFKRIQKGTSSAKEMGISPSQTEMVLHMLEKTQTVELSCDEVFELLDQYTEMVMRGEDVKNLLPLVHYHLEMCSDCTEEFEALKRILEARLE
jgi:predicted transcriptional regulator